MSSIWYNYDEVLSLNKLFMFIIGIRGGGKSYGAKRWAINDYIKRGNQFIYLRRSKVELDEVVDTLFADIAGIFPSYSFISKGGTFYIYKTAERDNEDFKLDDHVAGFALSLSTAGQRKSSSYPLVNKIIFDEFIIEQNNMRYLRNEARIFMGLYETVNRLRLKNEVRALFIGNAVSVINPYFTYFKIRPIKGRRFTQYPNMVIDYYTNEAFKAAKVDTKFGQILSQSDVGQYMMDNVYLNDSEHFIDKKSPDAQYMCTIIYNNDPFGVWVDYGKGKMYLAESHDPDSHRQYALTLEDHSPNTMLISNAKNMFYLKRFIDAYKHGYLFFDNQRVKHLGYEILELLI